MSTTMTRARGEGGRWGLQPEQSPISLIPDSITPGQRVTAFTLSQIADDYGMAAAEALDNALYPCPMCGLAFYAPDGWGLCEVCDGDDTADRRSVTIDEAALEQIGAYSPRCD